MLQDGGWSVWDALPLLLALSRNSSSWFKNIQRTGFEFQLFFSPAV